MQKHFDGIAEFGSMMQAIEYLKRSPLLAEVCEEDLRNIQPPPEIIKLAAGETLMRQGDTDSDYYLLIEGRLTVIVRDAEGTIVARGSVHPGEGVGEMAVMMNEPRSATVIARLDSTLLRFRQASFLNLLDSNPRALKSIARLTMRRLKEQYTVPHRKEVYPAITVVPLDPGIDTAALARDLAAQLSVMGPAESIPSDFGGLDVSAGPDFSQEAKLAEIESRNRYTLYCSPGGNDAWSRYLLQRSDLILLCTRAGSDPQPDQTALSVMEKLNRSHLGRFDLLIVHPPDWERRCATRKWLTRIPVSQHHHIRNGNRADLARLARIIAGTANNLVLGGGGAKSFSQLGALRAFAKAGVPIDRVGGSSMGAFVAALHCYGGDLESLIRLTREEFIRRRPDRDYTLPLLSVLSGKRLTGIGKTVCGDWQIEDLPYRYFCLSADLGEAELVEHWEGPVWIALRASGSLPGVGPPFLVGGRLLVDGGILNNLPVDIMQRHFPGSVIAIDVASHATLRYSSKYELESPSGFEILWNRVNPFGTRESLPNMLDILYRAATLNSDLHCRQSRQMADLLLVPPVKQFKVTDFQRFDEIVEIGYRHTMEVLETAAKDPSLKAKLWHSQGG